MKSDILVDDIRTTATEHPDPDLKDKIRALDKIIERLELSTGDMLQVKPKLFQKRSFWDELIDVNCTPDGQDYDDYGDWDLLREAWEMTGKHLSDAMHLHKHNVKCPTQKKIA